MSLRQEDDGRVWSTEEAPAGDGFLVVTGMGPYTLRLPGARVTPEAPEELMAEMAAYHEELARAGVLLDGSGGELEQLGVPYQLTRFLIPLGFVVALALVQFASWRLQQHEGLAKWLLTRRPHDVLWSYTHQLTVRRNGVVTGVHWSAMVSSASGYRVGLPALGQDHAQALVVAVATHCPGILLGFSPENAAAYLAKRKALEAQAATPAR